LFQAFSIRTLGHQPENPVAYVGAPGPDSWLSKLGPRVVALLINLFLFNDLSGAANGWILDLPLKRGQSLWDRVKAAVQSRSK
jgi:hypothetical protein